MEDIELSYTPLVLPGGNITEADYNLYRIQPGRIGVIERIVINPLEEAMKSDKRELFKFPDLEFSVKKMEEKRNVPSWEGVYNDFLNFLRIRADDSKRFEVKDEFEFFEGIGYCIEIFNLLGEIEKIKKGKTSHSEFTKLYWPKKKKDEEPKREILIPAGLDFSVINKETLEICLKSKRFCSDLEKEVTEAYKEANRLWLKKETGYWSEKRKENEEEIECGNLPSKELSPVKRPRKIGKNAYIFVSLVREDRIQYKDIMNIIISELGKIQAGESVEDYRYTSKKDNFFVNITSVKKRIDNLSLQPAFNKPNGRYEIAP